MLEHGHSREEIAERLGGNRGRGHLRDAVYGAIDGTVTTFAIVAGVVGADLSTAIILVLGLANVLADGFSMAAANYSGTKAELDDALRLRRVEERHIREAPDGEREELRQILAAKGLDGAVLDAATDAIARDRKSWVDIMLVDEYGLAPVDPHPMRAALATFAAFVAAGLIPLVPFLLTATDAFAWSTVLTAFVFFGIGTFKSRWSLAPWWRSGLETLTIGGTAAAIAYGVGAALGSL